MADDAADTSKTSDEDWSAFEDSEDAGSAVSDGTGSGSASNSGDDDLTDHPSDDDAEKHHQSDMETRNLLDDADFEEDFLLSEEINTRALDEWDDEAYAMTPEQRKYYIDLFMHLQYLTQGEAHLDGALDGADDRIVAFFRKSGLDTTTLGHIWDLADINVDGKLNKDEFLAAMHIINLHKRGGMPIPNRVPAYLELRMTPQRLYDSPRSSEGVSLKSIQTSGDSAPPGASCNGHTAGGSDLLIATTTTSLVALDVVDSGPPKSTSDDRLNNSSFERNKSFPLAEFAADPPLCVDRHPVAVRSSHGSAAQLTGKLSLGSATGPIMLPIGTQPKGPPPEPPPRAYKGHARSASLDLNAKPVVVDFKRPNEMRSFTLPVGTMPPKSSSQSTTAGTLSEATDRLTTTMTHSKTIGSSIMSSDFPSSSLSDAHPPPSQPPVSAAAPPSTAPPPVPPPKPSTAPVVLKPNFHSRCTVLRQVNTELEAKLATLAQIRLQLKLRLDEIQGTAGGPNVMATPRKQPSSSTK